MGVLGVHCTRCTMPTASSARAEAPARGAWPCWTTCASSCAIRRRPSALSAANWPAPNTTSRPQRESTRVDAAGRRFGAAAGVHAHAAEVVAEAGFHEAAHAGGQRRAATAQGLDRPARGGGDRQRRPRRPLGLHRRGRQLVVGAAGLRRDDTVLGAVGALGLTAHRAAVVGTIAAGHRPGRHRRAHHPVGHGIGFAFETVVGRADHEPGLRH